MWNPDADPPNAGRSGGGGLDWAFIARGLFHGLVGLILVKTGLERLQLIWPDYGIDARIYMTATRAWLSGADPYTAGPVGQQFNGPPPSLVPFVPLTVFPDQVAIAACVLLSVVAAGFIVRRCKLPLYWLAFAPLVTGVWAGSTNVLVIALLVAGTGWVAGVLKVFALVPLAIWRDWRQLAVAGVALVVSAPFLPWGTFIAEYASISANLVAQAQGGLGATGWLIVPTVLALLALPRKEAGWLAVPALWPASQFGYLALAMPVGSPIIAVLMPSVTPGVPAVAVIVYAVWRRAWPLVSEVLGRRIPSLAIQSGKAIEVGRPLWPNGVGRPAIERPPPDD